VAIYVEVVGKKQAHLPWGISMVYDIDLLEVQVQMEVYKVMADKGQVEVVIGQGDVGNEGSLGIVEFFFPGRIVQPGKYTIAPHAKTTGIPICVIV